MQIIVIIVTPSSMYGNAFMFSELYDEGEGDDGLLGIVTHR